MPSGPMLRYACGTALLSRRQPRWWTSLRNDLHYYIEVELGDRDAGVALSRDDERREVQHITDGGENRPAVHSSTCRQPIGISAPERRPRS